MSLISFKEKFRFALKWVQIVLNYHEDDVISISVDVTNRCNLRCTHCYFYAKPFEKDILSDDDILKRIREVKTQNPKIIDCAWVEENLYCGKNFF